MSLQKKWFLALTATLLVLIVVLGSIFGLARNSKATVQSQITTQSTGTASPAATPHPTGAVPLGGKASNQIPQFSTTKVILAFTQVLARPQRLVIEEKVHAQEVRPLGSTNVYLVAVPSGSVLEAVRILRATPGVRYAEPDYNQTVHDSPPVRDAPPVAVSTPSTKIPKATGTPTATATPTGLSVPNDPGFPFQWGYRNTGQTVNGTPGSSGADEGVTPAWNVTKGSGAVVIGEVDTGVDYTHPDLAANIWRNPGGIGGCPTGTHGYNALTQTCDPMDDDSVYGGHGTHVAGILGASGNNGLGVTGVNWHTTILPIKWVTSDGVGATSDLLTSLDWLLQAKKAGVNIRVVNDSTTFVGTSYSQALSDEIDLLGQNGILFVTAAGNTGDNNDNPAVRRYPCGYGRATEICVTASDQNDALPSWANYGAQTVDLAAPGSNIYSTLRNSSYGFISGGSMASPQVAGAAALILSVSNMAPTQLKADILNNVDRLPGMQGKLITGGRLDICKALPGCVRPKPTATPGTTPTATATPTAGTLGLTSIGVHSDKMVPDKKTVSKATLSVSTNVSKLTLYVEPTGVSGQEVMRGILYTDQGGSPGTLLGVTATLTFHSTDAAGWYALSFQSPISLAPGTYWLGIICGDTTHVASFRWNNVPQSRAVNSDPYATGPGNSFGTANIDAEQMSIYAS